MSSIEHAEAEAVDREASAALDRAARLIEARGLWKGDFAGPVSAQRPDADGPPLCVMGALNLAIGGRADRLPPVVGGVDVKWRALFLLHVAVKKSVPSDAGEDGPAYGLVQWNDAPPTTEQQVVGALRRAADYMRGGE